jgi:hypothetical protein
VNTPLAASASERGPERQVHDLAVCPLQWEALTTRGMRFTIHLDEVHLFRIGDLVIYREMAIADDFDMRNVMRDYNEPFRIRSTGRVCHRQITHVLRGGQLGLPEGLVALSLAEEPQPGHTPCRI